VSNFRSGPIASAYLEVSRDRGGAAHEVRLRWEALADQLREQGADDKTLAAAGAAATAGHSQSGTAGRAVFAADGQVLHQVDLPSPPRREVARWSLLPHLLPLLAQLPEYVPHLVVRLGRVSATIIGIERTGQEVLGVREYGQSQRATEGTRRVLARFEQERGRAGGLAVTGLWRSPRMSCGGSAHRGTGPTHAEE
jgi:hypothetical protein